jgi:hypothetical protein
VGESKTTWHRSYFDSVEKEEWDCGRMKDTFGCLILIFILGNERSGTMKDDFSCPSYIRFCRRGGVGSKTTLVVVLILILGKGMSSSIKDDFVCRSCIDSGEGEEWENQRRLWLLFLFFLLVLFFIFSSSSFILVMRG